MDRFDNNFNSTVTSTARILPATDQIFVLLEKQRANFPTIGNYVKSLQLSPGYLLLPQTVETMMTRLNADAQLVSECISFLETVDFCSLVVYGDYAAFTEQVIDILTANRHIPDSSSCGYLTSFDDFIWSDTEDLEIFLANNPAILSFYIYHMVGLMTYSD